MFINHLTPQMNGISLEGIQMHVWILVVIMEPRPVDKNVISENKHNFVGAKEAKDNNKPHI